VDELPQRSWFGRNWIWVVPVGCLSPVLCCGGGIAILFFGVFSSLRSSEPYATAVARATASPEVKAQLGEPLTIGYVPNGNISINNGVGTARLTIPISGPQKSGTIIVDAKLTAGKWEYSTLEVRPNWSDKGIDLRPQTAK
jgi:Cytochrome oxidase complex assembly protein 1